MAQTTKGISQATPSEAVTPAVWQLTPYPLAEAQVALVGVFNLRHSYVM